MLEVTASWSLKLTFSECFKDCAYPTGWSISLRQVSQGTCKHTYSEKEILQISQLKYFFAKTSQNISPHSPQKGLSRSCSSPSPCARCSRRGRAGKCCCRSSLGCRKWTYWGRATPWCPGRTPPWSWPWLLSGYDMMSHCLVDQCWNLLQESQSQHWICPPSQPALSPVG